MTEQEIGKFFALRERLFVVIRRAIDKCGHHKSYEGAMNISFPNIFDGSGIQYIITLHCYVVGGTRRHEWEGETFPEAINKFEQSVIEWEKEY